MYKHLMQSYKEIIDKAEQLIARLKLEDLPLPSVKVEHNNSVYCHEKTIVHSVYIGDKHCDVWDYFYDIDTNSDDETIEVQVNQYLDAVEPVLVGICEAIALITYNQLQSIPDTPSCV